MIVRYKKTAALLLILSGAGYALWHRSHAPEKIEARPALHKSADTLHFDAHAPQLDFIRISEVEAMPEPLAEPLNARVSYDDNRTARVFSPITGRTVRILADVGARVKAGDGLMILDAPDYAQAVADASRANADLELKRQTYARAKLIYEAKGLAQKDLESSETDLREAEAEAVRAKARLDNLTGHALAGAQYVLRAPQSGVVSERQASAGSEVVADSANPQFVITDPAHVWVQVDLPEQEMDKLKVGQSVLAQVDAYPGETFQGKVTAIAGALDPVTRRMQVRCEIDNPALKLKPEMYAQITPIADVHSSLPRIPNTAIFTRGLYSYVFVEQSPGVLQRRKVTLSLQGYPYSYVKEGLKAGERIVTSGALLLNAELAGNE